MLAFTSMPDTFIAAHNNHNFYDCLMFSHGGVQNIKDLLSFVIGQHRTTPEIRTINHILDIPENNDFRWMDFYACPHDSDQSVALSGRGTERLDWSWKNFHLYAQSNFTDLNEASPFRYCLRALIRGHQHMPGGINRLLHVPENNHSWQPLEHGRPCPIDTHDVYTIISSTLSLPETEFGKWQAYGIISIVDNQWILIPHITRLN